MTSVAELFDWLVDGAPGAVTPMDVVGRMSESLIAAGIPVERVAAFVTTLHPTVLGRAFFWRPGAPVRVDHLTVEIQRSDTFQKSPVAHVLATREEVRLRLRDLAPPRPYAVADELTAEGFTDYACLPLPFTSGETHAVAFSTRSPGGFTEQHLADLRHVLRPLARLGEILAQRRVAANLLSTYVGHDSGERILAGRIRRGDVETIRAVVWFSDLRGFTEMSSRMPAVEVVGVLNELFDAQVSAIERHGGEVLKFMGDGLLAIFACPEESLAPARCDAALAAADEAFAALAGGSIRFGVALHLGEIAYGNIGGASRLDFTVIGSAVNVAARLEGLTGRLDRPVVVSEAVARTTTRRVEPLGEFELKGVSGAERVFAPAQ